MQTNEEQTNEEYRNEANCALASKKRIILVVELDTPEQAGEILRWMYATDKPMSSNLMEISWNRTTIPIKQYEALEALRLSLQEP